MGEEKSVIGVIGAGQMGAGIAQVAAQNGLAAILYDIDSKQLKNGKATIKTSLERQLKKGNIEKQDLQNIMNSISYVDNVSDVKAPFVIEVIVENPTIKEKVYGQIDSVLANEYEQYIIASNTSSIPITQLASYTQHPENFIGMHFMNPVPVMKGLEIIRGIYTSDDTYNTTMALAQKLGKEIISSKDKAGFVINRVLMALINESAKVVEEGTANIEDVDKGALTCLNHPMGPLALCDHIGLDTVVYMMGIMEQDLGESYKPAPLLKRMFDAGLYGKKTGKGFYVYEKGKMPVVNKQIS